MKVIYVAGPYRAPTAWERDRNIHRARELGAEVAVSGAYPVIPHSNTAHMDGVAPDELWLDGCLELLRRCDAVIFTPDWTCSSGARGERLVAERLHLPCFDSIYGLQEWLHAQPPSNGEEAASAVELCARCEHIEVLHDQADVGHPFESRGPSGAGEAAWLNSPSTSAAPTPLQYHGDDCPACGDNMPHWRPERSVDARWRCCVCEPPS